MRTSLIVTHGYRNTPHRVPIPSATPVNKAAKLNGIPKTRLNMLSVLSESCASAGSSIVDVRIATAR